LYSESPENEAVRDYWYAYPSMVQRIKDVATAHGFDGEYQVDELTSWKTGTATPDQPWEHSPIVAAKYASRGIVMHLGLDIAVSGHSGAGTALYNVCTVMAGAEPMPLPVHIQSTVTLPGLMDHTVIGIDVLHGFQQPVIASEEGGDLVIRDLLVKDYPIILRISPIKRVFLPVVLKGHPG
jgi:hypothetical protein